MTIKGKVSYIKLESGFWGIKSDEGINYIPVVMPEQLKTDGRQVEVVAEPVSNMSGMHMWGEYVKIISFET